VSISPSAVSPHPHLIARGLLLAVLVLAADQVTKWWVVEVLMQPPQVIAVTAYFDLVMAWNRGVSFGMFHDYADYMPLVLTGVALGIVAVLGTWLSRTDRLLTALALGAVIGGALGNVVDRLRFGAVADFLFFHYQDWYWPAFNLADSGITLGVAAIVIDGLFRQPRSG
jgi:signal peptidase II